MKRFWVFVVLLIAVLEVQGQFSLRLSLEERCTQSDVIVEGFVVHKDTYTSVTGDIYTRYFFQVTNQLKGEEPYTLIEYSSLGGVHGDFAQTVCPSFHLNLGDKGVVFLRSASERLHLQDSWMPVSVDQSWVEYDEQAQEAFMNGRYLESRGELLKKIETITGRPLRLVRDFPENEEGTSEALLITGVTPTTTQAGRGREITITGTDFGATQGVGLVLFRNVNAGSGSITIPAVFYTSWTDTEIVCEVPAQAGNGAIRVQNNSGALSPVSSTSLNITYNVSNVADTEPRLIDDDADGDGGYVFVYSDNDANNGVDFTSLPAAVAAVERAVNTWTAGTKFALYGEEECGTSTVQIAASDGVNLITFDNDAYDLDLLFGSSVLGIMRSYYSKCSSSDWEKTEMDMVLRRDGDPNMIGGSVNWEYGPATPSAGEIDFESVVLHEFGHGHGLGHTRVSTAVMFPSITIGATNRNLQTSESTGGGYIHDESKAYIPPTSCGPARRYGDHDPTEMCSFGLPLDLVSFRSIPIENSIDLKWTTTNEIGHNYIILQCFRQGRWQNVARFWAKGNDQLGYNQYAYTDKDLWPAIYEYRLKIVALDGMTEYSHIVSSEIVGGQFDPEAVVVNGQIEWKWQDRTKTTSAHIFDVSGRQVWSTEANGEEFRSLPVPITSWGTGVYILSLRNETGWIWTQKVRL